jgi:cytochrome c-type biogenesis protein CcmH
MRRILTVVAVLVGILVSPALAAPSETAIAKQLRCVTCGTTLDVSNAPSSLQMKARIAREIAAGKTEQQIIDGFVRDYGRTILSNPPKSGMDLWLAWVLPLGLPILMLFILPFIVRGWRRSRAAHDGVPAPLDEADDALVDRELEALGDG